MKLCHGLQRSNAAEDGRRRNAQGGRRVVRAKVVLAAALLSISGAVRGGEHLTGTRDLPINRNFYVTHWNSKHGLPQNLVRAVLQTRDGYLWLGTQFGLVRFDGLRFTIFDRYRQPEMPNDAITGMAEDPSGTLWISTDGGLLKYESGQLRLGTDAGALGDEPAKAVYATKTGVIWIRMRTFFVRIQGGKLARFSLKDVPLLNAFSVVREDESGAIWVASPKRLLRFDDLKQQFQDVRIAGSPPAPSLWLFSRIHSGKLWVTAGDKLYESDAEAWRHYGASAGLNGAAITVLFEDRTGALWLALQNGEILRLSAGQISRLELPQITDATVHAIQDDLEGNVWIASDAGLLRLTPTQVRTFTRRDGLQDNVVWSVSAARDGGVWAGTRQGLNRLRDDRVVSSSTIDAGFGISTAVRAVVEDSSGTVWIGRSGTQLRRSPYYSPVLLFQNERYAEFRIGSPSNDWCRALFLDSSNRMWLATEEGVFCWRDRFLESYLRDRDAFYGSIRAILMTRHGDLWLGSYGSGLRRIRGDDVRTYGAADGLSNTHAWALHEDPDGLLWVGTENGLNRFNDERFFAFTRRHGMHENIVNQIVEDDFGNLWLSGLRGIYRVRRQDLNDVAAGLTNAVHAVAFGEAEGMESAETNGENQPAGCKTPDGRLWFPTQKGVVSIDPRLSRDNRTPPPVVIEEVLADDVLVLRQGLPVDPKTSAPILPDSARTGPDAQFEPAFTLKPGTAHLIEIRYTANALTVPERVRFKCRLEGFHEGDWHDVEDRRVATYTSLPPGTYRFHVIACNSHGYWNQIGAAFRFRVAPHFYETWPFYLSCVVLGGAAIMAVLAIRLRLQRKFLRLGQEAELERVRARIAEDMHDDIGASLSQIAILSEVARRDLLDPRRAELNVERISGIARQLVDSLSELVWATNPRNDKLDNMATYFREYAARYFEPTTIRCHLDFSPRLTSATIPPEIRRALFLILKEALHNIVKHSGASEASVSLRCEHQTTHEPVTIEMLVADNGRGLPAPGGRRFGNGLRNMNRRAESMKGRIEFESSAAGGTKVRIRVPLGHEAN